MIREFTKYYRAHVPLFLLDFGSAFLASLLDLVFPKVVNIVIDDLLPQRNIQLVIRIGIFLFFLYIIRYILGYIVHYYGHTLGTKIEYDMRQDLFNHIQKLSFTYFDNNKTGHIMSRIVNDLNEISELAHHGPEDLFIASVTLIGTFFILLNTNWQLTLLIFAIMPFMAWFSISKNQQMEQAFRNTRLKIADINAQLEDSISGIREVKAFTNEDYEKIKFQFGNEGFRQAKQKAYKTMAEFFSGMDFLSNFINLVVLIAGGWLCYSNMMTTGELVGFLLYVSMFLQPLRRIMSLLEIYQSGMAGFRRFREIMEIEPEIVDKPGAIPLDKVRGNIVFDNVAFSYDNKTEVFSNISFKINAGETVAFVGPSGAGKTTLASLIPRFYEIEEGAIYIDGIDIRNVTQKSLRQNIGIVQQNVFLFTGTVRDNIAYGKPDASDEEIINAAKKANAHDFIMELENGYDTYIGERGVKLSGGQKQRLAIARIFLKDPPILILDEATSALDNETEQIIQESLFALSKNRTTLIIAHRLATIRHAGRIFVLTKDGIVEEGSHQELISKQGLYYRLYNAQFGS
ncbi:ABC transporter ATP-binding protein [Tepidanaerobacter sp. EBM-49]|uniref:ABC transporter ATP-binding protein n=1 Tax=Tepidanaerobacter sp. EBM-49 TaxID=1918504 RepID=UPI000B042ED0|nr:ABC transporter ATP-binding protein [Tepidanaerobacter sp. EBM-49]